MALAVTARSSLGIAGPLLGSLGDRIGRRKGMLIGMTAFGLGSLLVAFWPSYPTLFIALLLGSAGKMVFDPAMQAYLGDRVAYEQRGGAIAATEIGWSGASLLGLPLVGWLMARLGWVAPFPLFAGLALIFVCVLARQLPRPADPPDGNARLGATLSAIWRQPSALAALSITFLISVGNEAVNIVYGLWLEGSFGLQIAALGLASAVIGGAELTGEGTVALFTDRFGKRRSALLGTALIAFSCLLLPLLARSLPGALFGLFLFYLSFEFTFVSLIPLMTELTPSSRATLMAGNITAAAGGRAVGALIGTRLFPFGMAANTLFGAAAAGAALGVLARVKVE